MNFDQNFKNKKSEKEFMKLERRKSDRDKDDYFNSSINKNDIGERILSVYLDLRNSEIYKFQDDLDSDQD